MMVAALPAGRRRRSVVRCYLTRPEKEATAVLAREVGLSESDLARLLLLTASAHAVKALAASPAWAALCALTAAR